MNADQIREEARMWRRLARRMITSPETDPFNSSAMALEVSTATWNAAVARIRSYFAPGQYYAYPGFGTREVRDAMAMAALWLALDAEDEQRGAR